MLTFIYICIIILYDIYDDGSLNHTAVPGYRSLVAIVGSESELSVMC
jgi:hypothetical protein